ncbi:hypothetical protein R1sor_003415 [Riccia sorocarpa]|uniref:Uncharacterized protein n=1 Tax=Riccia sorocarpa TaxID=122646 RepID=A0ABD3H1X6_9MARC
MVAEAGGTRTFKKKKSEHYQVSLVEDSVELRKLSSPEYGQSREVDGALWDASDPSIFVLWNTNQIFVYVYAAVNIHSSKVTLVQSAVVPSELCPHALNRGALSCQSDDVQETTILPTHTWTSKTPQDQKQLQWHRFEQRLNILHLEEALADAVSLKDSICWDMLISKALEHMNVEVAVKACQHSGNVKLLTSLRALENLEEYLLLRGYILALSEDTDAAEASFMKSSRPEVALELRWDLEQWDRAIALARELQSPLEIEMSKKYALVLEKQGDYRQALSYYEQYLKTSTLDTEQRAVAKAGIARTSVRLGDIWKGKHLVTECSDSLLYRECAKMLEGLNLHEDAAELYVLDGQVEKAIGIYLDMKNFPKMHSLLEKIESPKWYAKYARALEAERKLTEAAAAYVKAEDFENAVRLYLGPLRNPTEAFSIIRKARSMEAAKLASRYCKNKGDYENAIEFLVLQKRTEEARELAQQQDKMDMYTEQVADVASEEECSKLGKYYEAMGNYEKATAMFERCGNVKHALKLYQSWGTPEAMEQAINMVRR